MTAASAGNEAGRLDECAAIGLRIILERNTMIRLFNYKFQVILLIFVAFFSISSNPIVRLLIVIHFVCLSIQISITNENNSGVIRNRTDMKICIGVSITLSLLTIFIAVSNFLPMLTV